VEFEALETLTIVDRSDLPKNRPDTLVVMELSCG
jgi:hypothetical protein